MLYTDFRLQHTTTHYNTLQHTATHCNKSNECASLYHMLVSCVGVPSPSSASFSLLFSLSLSLFLPLFLSLSFLQSYLSVPSPSRQSVSSLSLSLFLSLSLSVFSSLFLSLSFFQSLSHSLNGSEEWRGWGQEGGETKIPPLLNTRFEFSLILLLPATSTDQHCQNHTGSWNSFRNYFIESLCVKLGESNCPVTVVVIRQNLFVANVIYMRQTCG